MYICNIFGGKCKLCNEGVCCACKVISMKHCLFFKKKINFYHISTKILDSADQQPKTLLLSL